MPALVNINVGSLRGTSGLDATTSWPFLRKYLRKALRISLTPVISCSARRSLGPLVKSAHSAGPARQPPPLPSFNHGRLQDAASRRCPPRGQENAGVLVARGLIPVHKP